MQYGKNMINIDDIDFAAMKLTFENDPQKLRNKNNNYIILDQNNNPLQFIYNKYNFLNIWSTDYIY